MFFWKKHHVQIFERDCAEQWFGIAWKHNRTGCCAPVSKLNVNRPHNFEREDASICQAAFFYQYHWQIKLIFDVLVYGKHIGAGVHQNINIHAPNFVL